jgi:aspartate-semialdehyde dehydrogenase
MESSEPEIFPLQIAFNLVPHGSVADAPAYESRLTMATARLAEGIEPGFSVVWAPLFFGATVALHVRTKKALDIQALRAALGHQDEIVLMETELPAGVPTPATDAQGSDKVFVGRIRVEGRLVRLWLVFDPVQLEAARLVDAVENWIDMPPNSMLT